MYMVADRTCESNALMSVGDFDYLVVSIEDSDVLMKVETIVNTIPIDAVGT